MSARSKDMIGATLIAAGIPMAGEIHLAAGPSTLAFASYWKDWFENDKYHDSTNCISVGYAALVEGRGDVLLAAPRTDLVISTSLVWSKDNTHLVGAGQLYAHRPNVTLVPGGSAVTAMLTADATGCIFSGLTLHNAAVTASSACIDTFVTSTNAIGTVMRNCFVWGPEDDTVNDSTGGWRLIYVKGGGNLFQHCQVGYGWPITADPASADQPCLVKWKKSVFNDSVWEDCIFQGEFTVNTQHIFQFEYAMAAGCYHIFRNCQMINVGSTALLVGIGSQAGAGGAISGGKNLIYFDSNSMFSGVTDVSAAANESYIKFPSGGVVSTGAAPNVFIGLAQQFDHTS